MHTKSVVQHIAMLLTLCYNNAIYPVMDLSRTINPNELLTHTKELASDSYQGRFPGSPGEEKTVAYLTKVFTDIGLKPGNVMNNSFLQPVPLVEVSPRLQTSLIINKDSSLYHLEPGQDFLAEVSCPIEQSNFNGQDMIFVGFGIKSDEYHWNDYKDIDVKNKIIVTLVNDPGFVDPNLFRGKKMTYYGRWTYKFEEAIAQGAGGVFVIHQTDAAGYPWSTLAHSGQCPYITLKSSQPPIIQGWINEACIQHLIGKSYHELAKQAAAPDFKPYTIATNCLLAIKNTLKDLTSHNVLALLPGKKIPDEYLFYTAHWDHFGVTDGNIYHGARDNALSVSALIALAKTFVAANNNDRSIMFLIPTAEEQGLLGSYYYADNPLVPLDKTIGVINMDMLNIFGKTSDVTFYGDIVPSFYDYVTQASALQNRVIKPDPTPENGMFYRSDHFPFAKKGIPALFINMGYQTVDQNKSISYILDKNNAWINQCYHKPEDQVIQDSNHPLCWNLEGAVDDVQLLFLIGQMATNL